MNIAVEFNPPNPRFDFGRGREGGPTGERAGSTNILSPTQEFDDVTSFGNPLQRRSIAMLNNPVWASTVGYADLVRAYPPKAGGMEGYAVTHCQVSRKGGVLSGCMIIKEDPDKHGFGKAALALAGKFRVAPEWASAPGHAALWVDIPFRFPAPGGAREPPHRLALLGLGLRSGAGAEGLPARGGGEGRLQRPRHRQMRGRTGWDAQRLRPGGGRPGRAGLFGGGGEACRDHADEPLDR